MLLAITHLILTSFMTGLIWMVQIVHYPLFSFVERSHYSDFQNAHMHRISLVVLPIMIAELITALLLLYSSKEAMVFFLLNAGLLTLIWIVTFVVFTFIHARLRRGYDDSLLKNLVEFNWIRTGLWTFRTVLISIIILQ